MEAEKSPDLLSASWRQRKASGVILSESKGLWTRGANGVNRNPWAGKDERRCCSSTMRQEKEKQGKLSFLCLLSYPGPQWIGWGPPAFEEGNRLSALIQMLILPRNTLSDTSRNVLISATWRQSSGHIKLPSQSRSLNVSYQWEFFWLFIYLFLVWHLEMFNCFSFTWGYMVTFTKYSSKTTSLLSLNVDLIYKH